MCPTTEHDLPKAEHDLSQTIPSRGIGTERAEMNIEDFFSFEPVGRTIDALETPVPVIDIDVVDCNLKRWQDRCDRLGIANRPHIKTHKLVPLAKYQIALGAKGITVQKLGEAEVMADAGISDILVTFNIVGGPKIRRLAALAKRTAISVVADHVDVVKGIGEAGMAAGRDISVLVECDTGARRNGVSSPVSAAELAREIDTLPGVTYGGLMTYAAAGKRGYAEAFLVETRDLLLRSGLASATISTGGSPDMWSDEGLAMVTEYRAGTYAYYDRSLVESATCTFADCGLTVLSTIVSRPSPDRAIVDAGSKALSSDLLKLEGYAVVPSLENSLIYDLNEEHGYVDVSRLARKPSIGELIRIVPNHVCPVSNLFDRVVFARGNDILGAVKVDARGAVQ